MASQLYPSSLTTIADPLLSDLSYLRWRVYVTFDMVNPSLFTRYKTSNRRVYDKALALLPKYPSDTTLENGLYLSTEVLIDNERCENVGPRRISGVETNGSHQQQYAEGILEQLGDGPWRRGYVKKEW